MNAQGGATYPDLIFQAFERFPDRTAFVDDERAVSYAEATDRVAQIANVLLGRGLRKGDGVAVLATNRPETFLVQAATLCAGLRYTPLHPLGSALDHARILQQADVTAVIYEAQPFEDRIAEVKIEAALPDIAFSIGQGIHGEDLDAAADAAETSRPDVEVVQDDLAYLPFTGGTTGVPKGVMLSHRSVVENALITLAEWDLPGDVRFLASTPISHASGLIITPTLLRGGTVILQRGFSPAAFLEAVERHRPTITFLVPTMIYALLDSGLLPTADVRSLETIVYGASPMSPARMQEAIAAFGPVFMQLYAQTEAPNTVTALRRSDHAGSDHELLSSCGRPLAGVTLAILDEDGREVPRGTVGEICVRGRLVMDGYWNDEEATRDALRDGWLHTGDLAYQDIAGYVYIVDRKKDMIVSGGFNVYPREIEDVLVTHPGVRHAAVIGIPDQRWGEAVKAIVVPDDPPGATEAALIEYVRERKGPVYAPKSVDFIETMPLTPLGKPDKKALRALHWEGLSRAVN